MQPGGQRSAAHIGNITVLLLYVAVFMLCLRCPAKFFIGIVLVTNRGQEKLHNYCQSGLL